MDQTLMTPLLLIVVVAISSVISSQQGVADDKNAQAVSLSSSDQDSPRLVRRYVPQFVGKRDPVSDAADTGDGPEADADADQELSENELNEQELLELLSDYDFINRFDGERLEDLDVSEHMANSDDDVDDTLPDSDSESNNSQEEKRYVPSFVGKRYIPNFVGKRYVPNFVGKRYVPSFVGKRYVPSFVGKRYVPSFVGKRYVPSFVGKRYVPSFVGKRYVPSFVGKRYVPSFVGKRYVPSFVGRKRYQPTFVGKRYVPSFVGKRYRPLFVGKRYQPTFVGKRDGMENYRPTFVGKRYVPSFVGKRYVPSFVGKRYVPSFVGKRSTLDGTDETMTDLNDEGTPVLVEKRSAQQAETMSSDEDSHSRRKRSLMEMEHKRTWGRPWGARDILTKNSLEGSKRFVAPEFVGRRDSISTILSALKALQVARSEPRLATKRFQAPLFIGKRSSPGDSSLYWNKINLDPLTESYLNELQEMQL